MLSSLELGAEVCVFSAPGYELYLREEDGGALAMKRLPVSYRHDKERIAQFDEEHRFVLALRDHRFAEFTGPDVADGTHAYVAGPVPARTLLALFRDSLRMDRPIPPAVGLALTRQVVDVLALHVDSPVFLDSTIPRSVEFNPAALLVASNGSLLFTHVNTDPPPAINTAVLGGADQPYLHFTAPEQCITGRTPSKSSYLFTAGALLFALLTGKGLFSFWHNESVERVLGRKARGLHPRVSDVRPEFEAADEAVLNLLHPLPEARRFDAGEFRRILEALDDAQPDRAGQSTANFLKELDIMMETRRSPGEAESAAGIFTRVTDIAELNDS